MQDNVSKTQANSTSDTTVTWVPIPEQKNRCVARCPYCGKEIAFAQYFDGSLLSPEEIRAYQRDEVPTSGWQVTLAAGLYFRANAQLYEREHYAAERYGL